MGGLPPRPQASIGLQAASLTRDNAPHPCRKEAKCPVVPEDSVHDVTDIIAQHLSLTFSLDNDKPP